METTYTSHNKIKHRTEEEKKEIKTRLKTIEGQVRGVSSMIDEDRYCDDILIQISAINHSLKSLGNQLLKIHLSTCVVDHIKNDKMDIIEEVMDLIKRLN